MLPAMSLERTLALHFCRSLGCRRFLRRSGNAEPPNSRCALSWLVVFRDQSFCLPVTYLGGRLPYPVGFLLGISGWIRRGVGDGCALPCPFHGQYSQRCADSAIVCAALPVLVGAFTPELTPTHPANWICVGFLWYLAVEQAPSSSEKSFKEGMVLAFSLPEIGFGGFFVFIAQVDKGQVFAPILIARIVTLGIAFLMLKLRHTLLQR